MPELPEVETMKRGLEAVMAGQRVRSIEVRRFDLRFPVDADLPQRLAGVAVRGLRRRGKYILIQMEGEPVVVLHLGMSGRVIAVPPGRPYSLQKHDHVIFTMDNEAQVVFNDPRRFGFIVLMDEQGWQGRAPFCAMGPEPLAGDFDGPVLAARLSGRSMPIKAALLDQRIVAGVGNIYACEALHAAGIHPGREAGSVQGGDAERLAACVRRVLERAIEAGGSTLKDYKKADGSPGYFQHEFSVYDRQDTECPVCAASGALSPIRRIVQSGRSTFYCPGCQK